jgi:hypothetical protein
MDDLDRLAFRVARTVRTTYPHLMEHGFTLSDLEERLAPYPEARREMASAGPDGYELTVLRLLAGERGYLAAEPELQEACRRALQMASPTVSIVRTWARSTLTLRNPALSLGNERASGSHERAVSQSQPAVIAQTSTSDVFFDAPAPSSSDADHCDCHFCGGTLPNGRAITYCPYCGLDLTVRHCPACSTELERSWRFCVTCGRQADDGDARSDCADPPLAAGSTVANSAVGTSADYPELSAGMRRSM